MNESLLCLSSTVSLPGSNCLMWSQQKLDSYHSTVCFNRLWSMHPVSIINTTGLTDDDWGTEVTHQNALCQSFSLQSSLSLLEDYCVSWHVYLHIFMRGMCVCMLLENKHSKDPHITTCSSLAVVHGGANTRYATLTQWWNVTKYIYSSTVLQFKVLE